MPRLAKIPTKKKQTPFKHQRNTLDQYFSSPKTSLDDKKPTFDENEKNGPNISSGSKRKIQTDSVVVKLRKVNENFTNIPEEDNVNISAEFICAKLVLEKLKISKTQETVISNDPHSSMSQVPVNGEHTNLQKKNTSSSIKKVIQKSNCSQSNSTVEIPVTPLMENDSFDLDSLSQSSMEDSDVIDTSIISTSKLAPDVRCESRLSSKETTNIVRSYGEVNRFSSNDVSLEFTSTTFDDKILQERKRRPISAISFKEIVVSLYDSDFLKPYQKLGFSKLPQCYDFGRCKGLHKGTRLKEVNSFQYGHVFNILDSSLSEWNCDILPTIALVMTRDQYLRGDMLRMFFDYILYGPNEDLMWDIKTILETHWSMFPPCSDHMQEVYLELLDRRYQGDSFFKTKLTDSGVLMYIMDQMEQVLKPGRDGIEINGNENKCIEDDPTDLSSPPSLTFDVLQERFNNHQPLFDEEQQETVTNLEVLFSSFSQVEDECEIVDKSKILIRLTLALEIIVDLLENDFVICVSRLKSSLKGECEVRQPLVKHLVDEAFQSRVLAFYQTTTNKSTWQQLSRIIGLIAETIHLFSNHGSTTWTYPNIHKGCEKFASAVFEDFNKGGWDENESYLRLQSLRPPWLQQLVALAVAESRLNLDLGTGIQAVVDIIHTHVVCPVKFKKDLKKIEPDLGMLNVEAEKFSKASKKKNQYGETLLHRVCKSAKFCVRDVECVLAMADTDINAKDNNGWTPLHEAVNSMSPLKVELLLHFQPQSGRTAVDVGVQNNDGITPLHEAVETGSLEICQLLVECGGISLLRKKDNNGVTPLMLSKNRELINQFFKRVIKAQEELNLNSSSLLKLPDAMIKVCMLVCEAFISGHHTWQFYQVLKYNKDYIKAESKPYVSNPSLFDIKTQQVHFRKLRKIIEKLAENPENSYLVRLWNNRFIYVESSVQSSA